MGKYVPLTLDQFSQACEFIATTIPANDETPQGVAEFASELLLGFLQEHQIPPNSFSGNAIIDLHRRLISMFYFGKAFGNEELRQKIEEILK